MARPPRPQNAPSSEKRTFDLEEAAQAKDRLAKRVAELKALDAQAPDYLTNANIALDSAQTAVRDIFGANSDEARVFRLALMRFEPAQDLWGAPVAYGQREAVRDRVQEAIPRLDSLTGIVDEKTIKGGVGVVPTTTPVPIRKQAGGSTATVKLFISWSGELSHRVALHLREWLPVVLPLVEPWVSSEDIPKGRRWGAELAGQLEGTNSGIVCLDAHNIDQPWLNFEAGALSKSVQEGRVHPFLLALDPGKLSTGPLGQFQATQFTKDDVKKLVRAINSETGTVGWPAERLDRSFEVCWPDLERRLTPLLVEAEALPADAERRSLPSEEPAASDLEVEELNMLLAVANAGKGLRRDRADEIIDGMHPQRALYILEHLEAQGLLVAAADAWRLSPNGRALLVRQGWL